MGDIVTGCVFVSGALLVTELCYYVYHFLCHKLETYYHVCHHSRALEHHFTYVEVFEYCLYGLPAHILLWGSPTWVVVVFNLLVLVMNQLQTRVELPYPLIGKTRHLEHHNHGRAPFGNFIDWDCLLQQGGCRYLGSCLS